jgi:hypothetical protein
MQYALETTIAFVITTLVIIVIIILVHKSDKQLTELIQSLVPKFSKTIQYTKTITPTQEYFNNLNIFPKKITRIITNYELNGTVNKINFQFLYELKLQKFSYNEGALRTHDTVFNGNILIINKEIPINLKIPFQSYNFDNKTIILFHNQKNPFRKIKNNHLIEQEIQKQINFLTEIIK